MKKGKLFFAVAAIGVMTLVSCKKDFDCECKGEFGNYTYTMTESKRSAAAAVCEGKGIGPIEVNGQPVEDSGNTNCSLK